VECAGGEGCILFVKWRVLGDLFLSVSSPTTLLRSTAIQQLASTGAGLRLAKLLTNID